mmetsp:Transcript_13193/g.33712  ORF Transcript_13193/g.33712 Transcript_13193/m.33712 type:complete len:204 (-) Transcript_13193:332-943(-)
MPAPPISVKRVASKIAAGGTVQSPPNGRVPLVVVPFAKVHSAVAATNGASTGQYGARVSLFLQQILHESDRSRHEQASAPNCSHHGRQRLGDGLAGPTQTPLSPHGAPAAFWPTGGHTTDDPLHVVLARHSTSLSNCWKHTLLDEAMLQFSQQSLLTSEQTPLSNLHATEQHESPAPASHSSLSSVVLKLPSGPAASTTPLPQ